MAACTPGSAHCPQRRLCLRRDSRYLAKDARIAALAQEGDRRAVRLARLTNQPARFLATIQVAITLSGFLGSAFAADNFSERSWTGSSARCHGQYQGPGQYFSCGDNAGALVSHADFWRARAEAPGHEKRGRPCPGALRARDVYFHSVQAIVSLLTASTNGMLRLLRVDLTRRRTSTPRRRYA